MKTIDNPEFRGLPNTTMDKKIIPLSEKIDNIEYVTGFEDAKEKIKDEIKNTMKNLKEELKRKRRITITPDKFDKELDKTFLKHVGEMK